ncbi:MAG: branched-chain amino acid transport system permease protein, partial [Frankiaceae bacterium]|nr:branched-chain amino acid transport system permease protein [Frankiaceae bacterium]
MLTLLNGISFGLILFLLASGLSLVIGAMGVLNLAHGALYMIGAYVGWSVAIDLKLNFVFAVMAGALAAGAAGVLMERAFFQRLRGAPDEQILASFGFLYIFTDLVKVLWGPTAKAPFQVPALSGSVTVGDFSYPVVRVVIIGVGLAFALGLWWVQSRSRVGAIVRAGMDDREMVRAMGINIRRVSAGLFLLGSAVAGA